MNKIKILEVVYKDPKGKESGGLERYAVNVKKTTNKKKFEVMFAYACINNNMKNQSKNDIIINIPNIPMLKKLIFNIKLYNYLKKARWKGIIHINGDNGVFCTKLKGVRTVFTLHGSSLQYATFLLKTNPINIIRIFSSALSGFMELYAYKNANNIISVSSYCADFMEKFKKRKYIVIPPGIENLPKSINKNKYKSNLKIDKNKLLCIFVGSDGKRKGLDLAISTIGDIKNDKIRLLIVGPNKKPKINNKCIFFGRIPDSKLKKLYYLSDILFFPSNSEGFPTVAIEAMSYGTVPLVYNKKPFNEFLNCKTSFLVKNKYAFASTLIDILKNNNELINKGRQCRIESKKFLINKLFVKYSQIFEQETSEIIKNE